MPRIHPDARTTPVTRAEIARSGEPSAVLAHRYGVSMETVRKWRERAVADCLDCSARPHRLPGNERGRDGEALDQVVANRIKAKTELSNLDPHGRVDPCDAAEHASMANHAEEVSQPDGSAPPKRSPPAYSHPRLRNRTWMGQGGRMARAAGLITHPLPEIQHHTLR